VAGAPPRCQKGCSAVTGRRVPMACEIAPWRVSGFAGRRSSRVGTVPERDGPAVRVNARPASKVAALQDIGENGSNCHSGMRQLQMLSYLPETLARTMPASFATAAGICGSALRRRTACSICSLKAVFRMLGILSLLDKSVEKILCPVLRRIYRNAQGRNSPRMLRGIGIGLVRNQTCRSFVPDIQDQSLLRPGHSRSMDWL
jgi:hypothetical protein